MPTTCSLLPYWTCCAYAVSPINGLRMLVRSSFVRRTCVSAGARDVLGPRRRDQGAEQPFVPGHLGVPLHAQHKPVRRVLDRLDGPVLGPAGDRQRARVVDALMVEAVHPGVLTHQPGDPAA